MAMRDKDAARFTRLLLTPAEAKALGLGAAKTKQLNDKIANRADGIQPIGPQSESGHAQYAMGTFRRQSARH